MGSSILVKISVAVAVCFFFITTIEGHRGGNKGGNRGGHGSFDIDRSMTTVQKQQLLKNATAALATTPKEPLIQLFTALTSAEALPYLQKLKIDPAQVNQILTKLKGTDQDVATAKASIKTYLDGVNLTTLTKTDWKSVGQLMRVVQVYMMRQQAKQFVTTDSTQTLTIGLTALAATEKRTWYRGILFQDLLDTLKAKGEAGRQEVTDKLVKWIDAADSKSLNKAALIYALATKFAMPTTPPPSGQTTFPPTGLPTAAPPTGQSTPPPSPSQTTTTKPKPE